MKFNCKKRKRFSYEFPLKGRSEGGFILRITESRADIEALDKEWKVVFSASTYEYAFITEALKQKAFEDLYFRAVAIFGSRLVFRDSKMVPEIYKLMENVAINIAPSTPEQSDEEILAEEKFMHEKTQESFDELQKTKEKKDSSVEAESNPKSRSKKSTKSNQNEQK